MAPVSTAPGSTRNTWTCPTCKHGSPDPRDELAHLDAHRQLGRFLQEWDAAVVSDRENLRRRRPAAVILAGLVAVAVAVAFPVAVFLGLARTGDSVDRGPAAVPRPIPPTVDTPAPAPAMSGPVVSGPASTPVPPETAQPSSGRPPVGQAPPPVSASAPSPSPAARSARPVAPATSATAVPAGVATPSVATRSVAPPTATTPVNDVVAHPAVPLPGFLLQVCLLGPCLTVL
ncbi:MAG: hypothetical protein ACR2LJ_00605 [Acidimicrobiales bacterium]